PSDIFPALVVYERPDGPVTPADQAKAAADARRFATIQDVTGKIIGPVPSKDGRALQVVVPIRVAEEGNGWEELAPRIQELRSIAQADTGGLGVYVTGPAGYFADFSKVFSGFDSTLLYITAVIGGGLLRRLQQCVLRVCLHPALHHRGDRDRHPAAHLPQPGAVAAPPDDGVRG